MGEHFRQTQLSLVVYRSVILEEEGSPYTLGIFLTEQAALDRLEVCKRQLNPNCSEQFWMWIETVRDGIVIDKKHVPLVTESQRNEVYASC